MIRTSCAVGFAALLALSACASTPPANSGAPAPREKSVVPEASAGPEAPAVGGIAEEPSPAVRGRLVAVDAGPARSTRADGFDETALSVWNDPAFRRRFAESYAAVSETEPRVTEAERDFLQEILDLVAADEIDEAFAELTEERSPTSSAVVDFMLANIHWQRDELKEAAAIYGVAVEKFPRFLRAWKVLALIHVRESDFQKAATALTRVIELGGGDAVTYGLLGYSYVNLENFISAESAYRMANLLDPATLDWKMGLARSFFKQSRYADAVALCDALIKAHPERADLWLLQANAYVGQGQSQRAAENYELVDRLGKSTPESLNMLADIYVNQDLFDLAVDAYIEAMETGPKATPDRAIRAAKALSARGASSETRRLIERVEELFPGDRLDEVARKAVLKLRARLAVAEGAGEEEARVLEEIVQLDPLDGEALILLGRHSQRAGDAEKAVFWFERAANLEAFEADAKVGHAQLLVGQGKYAEALPLLRRAQTLKPRENLQAYLEQVERVSQAR